MERDTHISQHSHVSGESESSREHGYTDILGGQISGSDGGLGSAMFHISRQLKDDNKRRDVYHKAHKDWTLHLNLDEVLSRPVVLPALKTHHQGGGGGGAAGSGGGGSSHHHQYHNHHQSTRLQRSRSKHSQMGLAGIAEPPSPSQLLTFNPRANMVVESFPQTKSVFKWPYRTNVAAPVKRPKLRAVNKPLRPITRKASRGGMRKREEGRVSGVGGAGEGESSAALSPPHPHDADEEARGGVFPSPSVTGTGGVDAKQKQLQGDEFKSAGLLPPLNTTASPRKYKSTSMHVESPKSKVSEQAKQTKGTSRRRSEANVEEKMEKKKSRWSIFRNRRPRQQNSTQSVIASLMKFSRLGEYAFPDIVESALKAGGSGAGSAVTRATQRANTFTCNVDVAEELSKAAKEASSAAGKALQDTRDRPASQESRQRFYHAMTEVNHQRPFFQAPDLATTADLLKGKFWKFSEEEMTRYIDEFKGTQGMSDKALASIIAKRTRNARFSGSEWRIDNSIFSHRLSESEGKSYFDVKAMYKKRLTVDWANATVKRRFLMTMAKNDDDGMAGLKQELAEVRDVFESFYPMICRLFDFYCCNQDELSENTWCMYFNAWGSLVKDFAFANNRSKYCKVADCDNIFIATNFEEDPDSELGQANNDLSLMRFEFLEALVRVSILKFGKEQGMKDISDSMEALISKCIVPRLPPEVELSNNVFRLRMYSQDCARLFHSHGDALRSIFSFYRVRDRVTRNTMTLEGFLRFSEQAGWLGSAGLGVQGSRITTHTKEQRQSQIKQGDDSDRSNFISVLQAKTAFMSAQMCCSDEIRLKLRMITISFTEFLEAIARVSQMFNPLSREQSRELIEASANWDWEELNATVRTREWEYVTKEMRLFPIHEHLEETLNGLFNNMLEKWDVTTEASLCRRLDAMTLSLGCTVFGARNTRRMRTNFDV